MYWKLATYTATMATFTTTTPMTTLGSMFTLSQCLTWPSWSPSPTRNKLTPELKCCLNQGESLWTGLQYTPFDIIIIQYQFMNIYWISLGCPSFSLFSLPDSVRLSALKITQEHFDLLTSNSKRGPLLSRARTLLHLSPKVKPQGRNSEIKVIAHDVIKVIMVCLERHYPDWSNKRSHVTPDLTNVNPARRFQLTLEMTPNFSRDDFYWPQGPS